MSKVLLALGAVVVIVVLFIAFSGNSVPPATSTTTTTTPAVTTTPTTAPGVTTTRPPHVTTTRPPVNTTTTVPVHAAACSRSIAAAKVILAIDTRTQHISAAQAKSLTKDLTAASINCSSATYHKFYTTYVAPLITPSKATATTVKKG